MASLDSYTRADGGTTYRLRWREPGAKSHSTLSIRDDYDLALLNKRLLDANGDSYDAAQRAVEKAKIDGPKVKDFMRRHIGLIVKIGDNLRQQYYSAVDNHFSGTLGNLPVKAVEQTDIVRWIREMQAKGASPKTIANHHATLSATMQRAYNEQLIDRNPCHGITLPENTSISENEMYIMTNDEMNTIFAEFNPHYLPFLGLLRGTGVRFGESTALMPHDFKLDARTPSIKVERAWKRGTRGSFELGAPKTRKGNRVVSLPRYVVDEVRPLVEATAPNDLVFKNLHGGRITASSFGKMWSRALTRLGYDAERRPRIHDLRHTHASMMLDGGIDMFVLSRRLGHESIKTTIDLYSHLVDSVHAESAAIADSVFA